MNMAVLAERSIQQFGEYEAVIFDGRGHTNTEILADARRFAGALRSLGVRAGDRVAVMMPNCIEVSKAYGGISAMGGVIVPIVFLLTPPEVHHILADCAPRAVLTAPELLPVLRLAMDGLPERPLVVVADGASAIGPDDPALEGTVRFEALIADAEPDFSIVDRADDDLAVIMYTSGTTGRPKGVVITHGNLVWMASALADQHLAEPGDVGLLALPVSHLFGLIVLIAAQVLGTRGVLLRWFTPQDVLEAVQRYGVTSIPMVPTMATYLLEYPEADRYDTSSLRRVILSAAPVPHELKTSFARRFGCEVLEGYGLTEASPAIAVERPGDEKRPGSCGRPVPGVQVAILDDDGNAVPAGQVGEICARSPGVTKGYYHQTGPTAETIRHGWLHTGDMGYLDEDGYLYLTDRKKDLIIRGGFNVSPRDVEEVLHQHPEVGEAAVVGRPDALMGEEVVAFVVPKPGANPSADSVLAFCRERLAKFKAPKEIRFVPALPRSPIGKVLKKDLRAAL